jgi:hypothetical protein
VTCASGIGQRVAPIRVPANGFSPRVGVRTRGAFTWLRKFINFRRWYRMCIEKRLINGGGWSWRWQWWKLFWRWEWCIRVNLLEPSAEVRGVDAVRCAAAGQQLFRLDHYKAALRMQLHAEWREQIRNCAVARSREWRVIACHKEINVSCAACDA